MSLSPRKSAQAFESFEEAMADADKSIPRMKAGHVGMMPLLLTTPVFGITKGVADKVEATYTKKGRGVVRYEGPALTQSHLSVLLVLVRARAGQPATDVLEFNSHELLTKLGWSDNTRNVERMRELIDDMYKANLTLWSANDIDPKNGRDVRFIAEKHTPTKGKWSVVLAPSIVGMFEGSLTRLDLQVRSTMREGLGTFLYGYISANSCNLPFSIEELHASAGSAASLKDFGREVRERLTAMKNKGLIAGFVAGRGAVKVSK